MGKFFASKKEKNKIIVKEFLENETDLNKNEIKDIVTKFKLRKKFIIEVITDPEEFEEILYEDVGIVEAEYEVEDVNYNLYNKFRYPYSNNRYQVTPVITASMALKSYIEETVEILYGDNYKKGKKVDGNIRIIPRFNPNMIYVVLKYRVKYRYLSNSGIYDARVYVYIP